MGLLPACPLCLIVLYQIQRETHGQGLLDDVVGNANVERNGLLSPSELAWLEAEVEVIWLCTIVSQVSSRYVYLFSLGSRVEL